MGESTNSRATDSFRPPYTVGVPRRHHYSDAGLLACRELDDAWDSETANECLQESRGGRNVQHRLVGLLRQSVYSRLAGYGIPTTLNGCPTIRPATIEKTARWS